MDEKDEKILTALQDNARMSWQELGELTGISRVAARKRVEKLRAEAAVTDGRFVFGGDEDGAGAYTRD